MSEVVTSVPVAPNFEKLKIKLRELFELDKADLDFGIYRILRQRHAEITEFLDKHLEKTVREALTSHGVMQNQQVKQELQVAEENARRLGLEPEDVPKVSELRAKYKTGSNLDATADEVYSHLFTFFSRYYQEGDFLGLPRATVHGREKYMIPYNGEEVKLVWANMNQYYIKSSELLRDYTFHIRRADLNIMQPNLLQPSDDEPEEVVIHFKLVEGDTEKDNRKSDGKTTRVFTLDVDQPFVESDDATLNIHFRYLEHASEKNLQRKLNDLTENALNDNLPPKWQRLLLANDPTYKGKDPRSLLQKHLSIYTARHQFDYFIHKDLASFLRRELDFYIKNEVMYLDDIEEMDTPKAEEYLSKLRALRRCAHPIIRMLAQLEEFQKKLWLKQKFVVETRYCLTLDHVPEELYEEICANDSQWFEWEQLYYISGIEQNLLTAKTRTSAFLRQHSHLTLDTRHFSRDFTLKLLASINNLDEMLDGICFQSENFQALQLMQERYQEQIKCVYIDPPYNTDNDINFPYKDSFAQSSWMTAIEQSASLAFRLLHKNGLYLLHIGDNERATSQLVLNTISETRKNTITVRRGVKNVQAQFADIEKLSFGHDVIHVLGKVHNSRIPHLTQRLSAEKPGKWDTFWRGTDRSTMRYELFGTTPSRGQWRWEEGRAKTAVKNYEDFLAFESRSKNLDEWYIENLQTGKDLDFVRKNEDGVIQYYVPPQGFRLISDNWLDISSSGNITDFPHEKSCALLERIVGWNGGKEVVALDYFAGSGTTAHATINLNRKDGGSRKYILVEMGEYFETVLVPRLKKIVYSTHWRDDRPENRNDGISHAFKIIRLESYEDTLNNLRLQRTPDQTTALQRADEDQRAEYMVGYFLDVESAGSASLLDINQFSDPFSYQMHIATTSAGETKATMVDLVETFNWLLGLKVKHIDAQRDFLTVIGEQRTGGRTLIIWRTLSDNLEADTLALEKYLSKLELNPAATEFDFIYVNGSHTLPDPHKKIHLIEEVFQQRMFESNIFESLR